MFEDTFSIILKVRIQEPIPKIDRHIACDFAMHRSGLQ